MQQLSPILTTARDILKENKNQAMHVNDIARKAVESARNQTLSVEIFAEKLAAALAAHLKLKTSKPLFTKPLNKQGRPQKGVYRLKQDRSPSVVSKIEAPDISTNFMGKAGEYAVMSELLFWGYNASLMSVDVGIDVVANKNNRYFHIQVKTSTPQNNGKFFFSIKKKAFDENNSASTYYVFVMREKLSCSFAILPSSHLHNLRVTNVINGQNDLPISITHDDKGKHYELNGSDITAWINNFGVIN